MGYNILNESYLEGLFDRESVHVESANREKVQEIPFNFYDLVAKAIREMDRDTFIIVDSSSSHFYFNGL
ncbi:MAG: hypothetical protein LBF25_02485 [Puniceicoccales bacterium]|nr:hypothetical protein [Puniceicoccales bacterium]